MRSYSTARLVIAPCLALVVAIGCTPFDSSTSGSNEGNICDTDTPDSCGPGLVCMVWPNCSFPSCCPPADPVNGPACYCEAPADAGPVDAGTPDAGPSDGGS